MAYTQHWAPLLHAPQMQSMTMMHLLSLDCHTVADDFAGMIVKVQMGLCFASQWLSNQTMK